MGYQTINYICGHEDRVQLYGKHVDRDRKAAWMGQHKCPACEAKDRAAKAAAQAAVDSEQGLPTLTGSDKQVTWAVAIRKEHKDALDAKLAPLQPKSELDHRAVEIIRSMVADYLAETSASIWIDRRHDDKAGTSWQRLIVAAGKQAKEAA